MLFYVSIDKDALESYDDQEILEIFVKKYT